MLIKAGPGRFNPGLFFKYAMPLASTVLLFMGGCSKSAPTAPPTTADTLVSFANQVQPIFTGYCALSGCHSGPQPQDGMTLVTGSSYSQIVNVPCVDVPGYLRVRPSSADSSFLYLKITGNLIAGIRMPYQRAPLSDTLISTIRIWINQGARDN